MTTLDCSDIDRYIGKPMQPARMVEPVANNDIRRWVQGMHYPNRLHYDAAYALESRWGKLIAPQSFPVTMDDGHGSRALVHRPASPIRTCSSAATNGGSTVPQIVAGDRIVERTHSVRLHDQGNEVRRADLLSAGRQLLLQPERRPDLPSSVRPRSATTRRGRGGHVGRPERRRGPGVDRRGARGARGPQVHLDPDAARSWSQPALLGCVVVGDDLPERVFGPHSIVSFATEWRAYTFTLWGGAHRRTDLDMAELGFTGPMAGHEQDPRWSGSIPS